MTKVDIKIYNSLSKEIEEITLNKLEELNMFVCGPTVYDYIHIGNARTFTFFDTFARFLRFEGIKLNYIQNITDIDDKIINRAEELKISPKELADQYTAQFIEDMRSIHADSQATLIRATDKIPEIIKQVEQLISKGNAYLIENDGYYFDLSSFPEYGKLSRRTTQMAEDGTSRIDENPDKRNRGDFCVWKFKKDDKEPSWPAPFGEGRPGWHIEDTAITESVFGPQYDIHGGGQDLMFPHHEAEIAQQESVSGLKPFVRYWIHCAFLINKEEKMSKSKGNFTTLHELNQNYSPEVIRYYFLSAHYRSPLNYDDTTITSAQGAVERIKNFLTRLHEYKSESSSNSIAISEIKDKFIKALANDFNTPEAFAVVFELVKQANSLIDQKLLTDSEKNEIISFFDDINKILGVIPEIHTEIPDNIKRLLDERQKAKDTKDFARADAIRDEISNLGYTIQDTPTGQQVTRD